MQFNLADSETKWSYIILFCISSRQRAHVWTGKFAQLMCNNILSLCVPMFYPNTPILLLEQSQPKGFFNQGWSAKDSRGTPPPRWINAILTACTELSSGLQSQYHWHKETTRCKDRLKPPSWGQMAEPPLRLRSAETRVHYRGNSQLKNLNA